MAARSPGAHARSAAGPSYSCTKPSATAAAPPSRIMAPRCGACRGSEGAPDPEVYEQLVGKSADAIESCSVLRRDTLRSEDRRVGKERVSKWRSGWMGDHNIKKK